ncbi:hypothetical protein TSUD_129690 [Trifolium subterraneum]|uniref:Reverse transcriptase domain-containing protein n=1 Tax=Trifolium subterraneum TaxID=3900 RepID=A0A2Z6N0V1_TRISU|nr:hypothetical protein TSUD_129690 [Trifolium subterraneum]
MEKLISPNQSAFIKGRQLVDGVLAVNEIIDFARKSKRSCLIFKVDFEKAYDSWQSFCPGQWGPTEEINIQRGLKQGDPLAPFLFLLVVEGLSGAIRNAEERNLFTGFRVGNAGLSVSHLQYADDTFFIGEATVANLWTLKAILRSFELASGLKVNFAKSSIIGVNVSNDLLGVAERFLHCRVGSLPFMYLGLLVGANPRKERTWKPLLDNLTKRPSDWHFWFVSLGGRVILLNSVLNSIPICYLSFMKMPVKIWKQIVKLQRKFLWGGTIMERKIPWVSWANVCKPKVDGGLGIRELRAVNLSLLGKWRWRLLSGRQGIWRDILLSRYGSLYPSPHLGGRPVGFRGTSAWWRDVSLLGGTTDSTSNWFYEGIGKKVGDGLMTSFWFETWIGDTPLKVQYQRLFQVSEQITSKVDLMDDVMRTLNSIQITKANDNWFWKHDANGIFSVKSAYSIVELASRVDVVMPEVSSLILAKVWKSWAPSKVIVFSWQLLQNRIASRQNLFRRKGWVLVGELTGWMLIWHAVIWSIWNSRNDLIFTGESTSVEYLVDKVKLFSWKWYLVKNHVSPCSLYEWEGQPTLCWNR